MADLKNILNKKWVKAMGLLICFLAVFQLGVFVGSANFFYYVPQPEEIDFSLFWDSYNKLKKNFVNPEAIDVKKIVYGAISGMTKTLGDPYTDFFDPTEAEKFFQDLSGSFEGIGVEIGLKNNRPTVISPLEGTPGKKAGLKPGDVILEINEKSTYDMTVEEAVSLIRGPKGTDVVLTVFRQEWDRPREIKITRDVIKIPAMVWELKEGDTAYIKIYQFDNVLAQDFRKAAFQILNSQAKRIILDLRNNPGGYLEVSQDIAGWFLEKGTIVTIEDFGQGEEQKTFKAEGSAVFMDYPTVVLINGGTASASEILAGALRDNRNVKLIGDKSFGKGSVQEIINLMDGSFLKITIAKWLTPKGQSISDLGLEPDIKVEISDEDIEQDKDPQLQKALEIIKGLE
ncbi:MAG: S41 family peptidase [Candidatus Staskawiczbacteria bacterium]|nr:S41 family peptidase [Candidatus Staskawiczbacteria bacterium]